jgi:hypothetical protein
MRHVHSTVVGIALFIQLFLPANLGLAQAGQETTRQQATTGKPTGVDLLNACEAYARFNSKAPNLTTDDLVGAMACLSYVNGFHDASMTMQILYQGHFQAFAASDAYIIQVMVQPESSWL